jgi:hypothetical protein
MTSPEHDSVWSRAGGITPTRDGHRRHRRHGWAGRLGEDVARGDGRAAGVGGPTSRCVRRSMDMRTSSHSNHALGLFIGMGLMLVSLFGPLTCPAESVAGVEPTADWDDRGPSDDRDHRSDRRPRDHRDDWPYGRPGSALPDRDTMHQGTKGALPCERIRGPVRTGVANSAAHRRSARVVTHVSRRAVCEGVPRGHVVATPGTSWVP